jgi:hypothetical protein
MRVRPTSGKCHVTAASETGMMGSFGKGSDL